MDYGGVEEIATASISHFLVHMGMREVLWAEMQMSHIWGIEVRTILSGNFGLCTYNTTDNTKARSCRYSLLRFGC